MDIKLPTSRVFLNLVGQIDHFRGIWAAGPPLPGDRLARIRAATKVRSIASSCRLTGIRVTDTEVAATLRGEPPAAREVSEILGYGRAIEADLTREGALVVPADIGRMNALVLGAEGPRPDPTSWRDAPIHLEAFDHDGRAMGRVFQTLPPRLLDEKMEQACTWLELELRSGENHPLLVIGAFYLVFVNISPFANGNTRTGRVVAVHLLRRAGYAHAAYASLERILEESREAYYDTLDVSSTQLWSGQADLEPWLGFFLQTLKRQADRVAAKVDLEKRALDLPPLQRAILETVREHGTARAALLLVATGTNRNTLKDNLRRMVERGLLERVGRSKGAFYRLATGEAPRGA